MPSVQAQLNNSQVIIKLPDASRSLPQVIPIMCQLQSTDGRPGETLNIARIQYLARVDPIHKRVTMLSIPRDTRVLWKAPMKD